MGVGFATEPSAVWWRFECQTHQPWQYQRESFISTRPRQALWHESNPEHDSDILGLCLGWENRNETHSVMFSGEISDTDSGCCRYKTTAYWGHTYGKRPGLKSVSENKQNLFSVLSGVCCCDVRNLHFWEQQHMFGWGTKAPAKTILWIEI